MKLLGKAVVVPPRTHGQVAHAGYWGPQLWTTLVTLLAFVTTPSKALCPTSGACASISERASSGKHVLARDVGCCLRSFPLDVDAAGLTIRTLRRTMNHYAFGPYAAQSTNSLLELKVSIEDELTKIRENFNNYMSQFDFDLDIQRLFFKLRDGHTMYYPQCFSKWTYSHGLSLMSVTTAGKHKIMVAPGGFHEIPDMPLGLPDFLGGEVLAIDGQDPVAYIKSFSDDQVGMCKDSNCRFNYALLQTYIDESGHEVYNPGIFMKRILPPSSSSIMFTLEKGNATRTFSLPFYATYTGAAFQSSTDYFWKNCQGQFQESGNQVSVNKVTRQQELLSNAAMYLQQSAVTVVRLVDSDIGVLAISSMDGDVIQFMRGFVNGVRQLQAQGVRRLIIDLTNNIGGKILLAYYVVNALFPTDKHEALPTRTRASSLATTAVELANLTNSGFSWYHWSHWADVNGDRFQSARNFFLPVRTAQAAEWSEFFMDLSPVESLGCAPGPACLGINMQPFGPEPPFSSQNVLLLTNGICMSTCSLVTTSLSRFHRVRTVTIGGIPGSPQQISNMPGGQVVSLAEFIENLRTLGLNEDERAPQPFVWNANLRFTWRAVFGSVTEEYPLEFVFQPSTFNLDYNLETALSIEARWVEVARLFVSKSLLH